jgi:hypothetical protein
MATLADIRKQYPQYADISDEQLAKGFHEKFYSDIPFTEFSSQIGFKPVIAATQTVPDVRSEVMAETGGGAAVGMPRRGRAAVVQPATPLEATATGVFKGAVVNPVLAATQVLGGAGGRQAAENIQQQYAQTRQEAGMSGFDVPQLIGAVASPVNRLIPGKGFVGGAIGASTQPLEGKYESTFDLLADKAKQVAGGAILGKVTDNLIAGLTPRLKEGARELMDQGVPVSPGQAYEGAPGWLFRQIESFGLGPKADKINKAFNGVVADDVLSTLGQRVPATVKPGQQAVAYTQNQISKYYDDALSSIGKNPLDTEYKQGINTAMKDAVDTLANPQEREFVRKKLMNSLNTNLGNKIDKNGEISGEGIKKVQEWLKTEVSKLDGKTGAVPEALKSGYGDVLANLNQFISRVDKDGLIANADAAWAKLYSFADASKRATPKGGIFNPEQLSQAAAAQAQTILSAGGGKGALNETAQRALNVLGKQDPVGMLKGVMIASKATTGVATALIIPQVAIPLLVASGMTYGAARQLMKTPSAARLAVKKALENNTGMFGAAGADLYNQMLREDGETK